MAKRDKMYPFTDWTDGVDYDSSPFTVGKKSLINASNIIPSTDVGGIAQRNGYQKFNSVTLTNPITGLLSFSVAGQEYFVCQAGTGFYNNSPEGTWNNIVGAVSLTSSAYNLTSFDLLAQTLWFRDRSDGALYNWTLSGNITQVPSGQLYLVSIVSSGNGNYLVGDVLTITGGGGTGGTVTITGVNAGTINALSITTVGSGYSVANPAATTGGTGTGATVWIQQISTPPTATICLTYFQKLWSFGDLNNPLIGTFSDTSQGNTHDSANNTLSFDDGQGQLITGACRWGVGQMLVFKDRSISLVSYTGTTPPFSKQLYADGMGCVSHQSIVTLPGGAVMWWDWNDIYIIQGNVISSATNHPITGKPRLKTFFRTMVNQNLLKNVCGAYYPGLDIVRWHFAGIGSGYNNLCLDYHVKTQSFWPGTLRGTSISPRVINGQSRIYSGDTNGYVYQSDFGSQDDGGNITSNAQLPWQVFEGLSLQKKLSNFQAFLELTGNYNIYADFYFDQGTTPSISNVPLSNAVLPTSPAFDDPSSIFDTSTFPVESSLFETSGGVNRLFKSVSVNIHNSGTSTPYKVDGVCFFERPLEATIKA